MTMTVLPSFQTFLENSATPQRPSLLLQRPHSPKCSIYGWHLTNTTSGMHYNYNSSCNSNSPVSSLNSERNSVKVVSSRRTNFKRPLTDVGLNVLPQLPLTTSSSTGKRGKKKYLKERERCEIVRRVNAGEKQSHLAKEFGVTRAAVCYLLKHQTATMRRLSQRPYMLPGGTYGG
ncbi:hypothetical protein KXD40_009492 [Peronospora effusa]|uniref:HTH psq-type domain-containing protein n=1 Tax=Peronospora effusa TaxID=542832 RepID=A0A3M6VDW4_9STRA|nr:hypothetical protein DD238_006669 [Peronospora effusa]RQM12840.1 hypothetical protein DD237_007427 [Peronospora effusa]UIZ23754.1 hypothetical protein KXD40_009492 [Peronospora effusa]CAI5701219.1 unnamed protein product [Peronospora effusa]